MSFRTLWIPQLLEAVLSGIFVFRLGMGTTPQTIVHTWEELTGLIRQNQKLGSWREKTEKKLRRNGAKYHYGKNITAMKYFWEEFCWRVQGQWECQ